MSVKLLTEHRLEFVSFKGGCTGSSESTLVKMPHCVAAQFMIYWLRADAYDTLGACADPGIFVRGVQVSLTKKSLTTFFF